MLYWDYHSDFEDAYEYDNSMDFNLDCSLENIAEIADDDSGEFYRNNGGTIFVWDENKELLGEFEVEVDYQPVYYVSKKDG